MLRRAALLALALAPLTPAPCWAQAVGAQATPEKATALQREVREWLAATLGPDIKIAQEPVYFKVDGDHYAVTVPLGDMPGAPATTATVKETGDGRWAVDNLRVTSPSTFHFRLPASAATGDMPGDVTGTLTIGQQTGQMLIDPSWKTPSISSSTMSDIKVEQSGPTMQQASSVGHATSNTVVTPAADGRLDVTFDGTLDDYAIAGMMTKEQTPLNLGMGKVAFNGALNGVSRERVVEIAHLLGKIGAAERAAPPTASSKSASAAATPDAAAVRALLEAMADVSTGFTFDEKIDRFRFDVGGIDGSLRTMNLGMTSRSDSGLVQAALEVGAEGLTLPDLGLGKLAEFIPSKLSIRPFINGVPADALRRMVDKLQTKQDPTEEDIEALFARGPIAAGIDNFAVEVGGATFNGLGKVLATSPTAFAGAGQITAENLDRLQQKLAADPQTVRAAPFIIFLKGIARAEQSRFVWALIYKDGRVLVNDQDMSALAGSVAPPPPPAAPQAARPRPTTPQTAPGRPALRPAPNRQQ